MKTNFKKQPENTSVEVGDVVILENGLTVIIIPHRDGVATFDLEKNEIVTSGITRDNLWSCKIGAKMFGYGVGEYEIVDIVKSDDLVISRV